MKLAIPSTLGLATLAGMSFISPAFAVVSMSWTTIGNANNSADSADGDRFTPGIQHYGAVDHAYNIGTYEVTNAQYVDFLNAKGGSNSAGIFNGTMGSYSNIVQGGVSGSYSYSVSSTYANMPVVGVTWFDAARFCNWLGNGQGDGDMETGAYTLNGAMSGIILANTGAAIYIPSENEWYKAAYYNGATAAYSLYPNGQNTITKADANYSGIGPTDVGYGKASSYGTYGQGGNAWEWHDAIISGSSRGLRGGSWPSASSGTDLASSFRLMDVPSDESSYIGFRVASVPEPSCLVLTILASGVVVTRRKR